MADDAAAEKMPLPQRKGNQGQVKKQKNQERPGCSQMGGNRGGKQRNKNNNKLRGRGGMFRGGRGGIGLRVLNRNQNRPNLNKPNQGPFKKKSEGNDGGQGGGNDEGQGGDKRKPEQIKKEDYHIMQRLKLLCGKDMYCSDLPPVDNNKDIKFSNRNRLYVGNLTNDVTEDELKEMFAPFGEIAETFINKQKNFAFVKVDFRANAEKAKSELDGSNRKGRQLRVRFSPNNTTIRVRNLPIMVTDELLYAGFEIFGPIEKAIHVCDDYGKPTGEGFVEFTRKSSAIAANRHCNEKCYFLTEAMRPCIVDLHDHVEDLGSPPEECYINEKNELVTKFGTFEVEIPRSDDECAAKFKETFELFKTKKQELLEELHREEKKIEAEMVLAQYNYETDLLREEIRMRELGPEGYKIEKERREKAMKEEEEAFINACQEQFGFSSSPLEFNIGNMNDLMDIAGPSNRNLGFDIGNFNDLMDIPGPSNRFQQQGPMRGRRGNQHYSRGRGSMRGGKKRHWDRREDNFKNKKRRF